MGSESSNNNNSKQLMETINLTSDEKKQLQRSKNKPGQAYAKLATQKPKILQVVKKIKDKNYKLLSFSKPTPQAEDLPLYEMVKVPGCFYQGSWLNGKQHGKGQIFTKSGIYYLGEFNNGKAECKDGLLVFPDGSYYRGKFAQNCFNGTGVLRYDEYGENQQSTNKFTYKGTWKDNKPQGQGVQIYQDGSKYQGNFVDGYKQGKGKFTWANGKIYQGNFEKGHMSGQGKLILGDGQKKSSFQGYFQRGFKVKGKLQTQYGSYSGNYQNGLMHDQNAKFIWKDGRVYQGSFQFGQMHGKGKITFPDNQSVSGRWQNGENIGIEHIDGGNS